MTTSNRTRTAAAIFDVDGTISATRSTTSLIWLRQRQTSAWQHRRWLASLLWRGPLAWVADQIDRDHADRMVYAQFAGLSRRRLEGDAERCCEEVLLPTCFPEALAEMAAHRDAGRRLVLVSGGLDVVLAPLARALGAELLAQRLVADGDRVTGAASQLRRARRSRRADESVRARRLARCSATPQPRASTWLRRSPTVTA